MSIIFVILFLLISFILLLFYWNEQTRQKFESKGVPYLGNGLFRMVKNITKGIDLINDLSKTYRKIKEQDIKVAGSNDFGMTTIFVTEPEMIKSVLVKDFDHFADRRNFDMSKNDSIFKKMLFGLKGTEWRALRSKLSPTFTTGKIKRLFSLFDQSGEKLVKYFAEQAANSPNNEIELTEGYSKYTMDVIASAACGLDSQAFDQKEPSLFEEMGQKMQFKFSGLLMLKMIMILVAKPLADLLGFSMFDPKAQHFFSHAIKSSIKQRSENKEKRNDFIQLMLEAREGSLKTDDSELENFEKDAQLKEDGSKERDVAELLDDDGIVANAVLFILAGFDTTQSLLLYIPYALALNTEVQEKLREEIDSVLEESDGKLDYDVITKMTYLDMVINETLRMFPPAAGTDRGCTMDYKVPGTDFTLKKGEGIVIPIYALHHDPEHFPDPEKFDPERFSPENKAKMNPYTFLPFGQGPRNCIGMRFALAEVKMAMAHLVHNFKIEPSKKTLIPMKFTKASSLKPEGGMYLSLHKIDR